MHHLTQAIYRLRFTSPQILTTGVQDCEW